MPRLSLLKVSLAALITLAAASRAGAQQQGEVVMPEISAEEMEMFQQMQQMGQQVMQNIQNSGMDMQELGQQMREQAMNGTFDPEAMQQMLIDRGIITQDMMNQLQGTVQKAGLASVRRQMNCSDEEWALLDTRIRRIIAAQTDVNLNQPVTSGNRGAQSRMLSPPTQNSEAAKALRDLKAILREQNPPDAMITPRLMAWRAAHQKAKAELEAAQADLIKILTLRQEAVLIQIGIL
jgi:hypothetical protein